MSALAEERGRRRRRLAGIRGSYAWLDCLPEHSYLLANDARILHVSPSAVEALGADLEQLLGKPFHPFAEQESAGAIEEMLADLRAGRSVRNTEVAFRSLRGATVTLRLSAGQLPLRGYGKGRLLLVGRDISDQVAAARKADHLLVRDPLTGVFNRRLLAQTLQREARRGLRYGHSVAFMMLDVDQFKAINDTYGHQAGDEVLQLVARILSSAVRETDLVIRYGGDEFLVIMPETNSNATVVADRVRQAFASHQVVSEVPAAVRVSLGVAHWSPSEDRTIESAIDEADRRMYSTRHLR